MAHSIAFKQAIIRGSELEVEGESVPPISEVVVIAVVLHWNGQARGAVVRKEDLGLNNWKARFPASPFTLGQEVLAAGTEMRIRPADKASERPALAATTTWSQVLVVKDKP